MKYEIVMGLEVHVELAAESKLFCSCSAKFGAEPNQNVCPACAGMPGMTPKPNKKAIKLGIAAGLVTNCQISPVITFDKKNYFYPDLPTGYQITQFYEPICRNGYVDIGVSAGAEAGAKVGVGAGGGAAVGAKAGVGAGVRAEAVANAGATAGAEAVANAGANAGVGANVGVGAATLGDADINAGENIKRIRIKQIHIEEDAGKLVHERGVSLIDCNRAGVPLVEIVSEPDFRTAEEVITYLEKLRLLLTFANVSDCRLQEGSMRCDVNLSVREKGAAQYGVRTEIKNMNSLKAITRAIEYESQRHIDALDAGSGVLVQETRRWDDNVGETFSMRSKEDATDYRYFPNPEILPIRISEKWIKEVRDALPETSHDKYIRMTTKLGISKADSKIIAESKRLADIFDSVMSYGNANITAHSEAIVTENDDNRAPSHDDNSAAENDNNSKMAYNLNAKDVASWIVTELLSMSTEENKSYDDIYIDCEKFAALISMVGNKIINRNVAKKILVLVYLQNIDPIAYVKENNLGIVSDSSLLEGVIMSVLKENEKSVKQFLDGNEKVEGFLMGKAMSKTAGKADPSVLKEVLRCALNGRR